MERHDRNEVLAAAMLAGTIAIFLAEVAVLFSAPASTPLHFVMREAHRRDGPATLGARRPPEDTVLRLAFAGDIMQHRGQANDDFRGSYSGVKPLLAGSDVVVGNLEFPVDTTQPVGPEAGSVRFNGSPAHLSALADAGFDVLSTANNHCFDQGEAGMARTCRLLAEHGLTPVGNLGGLAQSQPVVVERHGFRIGFYAYTFRPNSYADARGTISYWRPDWPVHELNFADWSAEYRTEALDLVAQHVRAGRDARVDWLVALVHWGREWEFQPTADQVQAGRDLIERGFDLVVGGHGHVLNPVEVHRDRLIAYSLGNLVSDFRPWQARTGGVLQVDLARTSQGGLQVADFRVIPIITDRRGHRVRPVRADGAADQKIRELSGRVLGPACAFAEQTGASNR